ncbi:MAG: chemotaxis protein CheD [Rhodocyclaceae bacterium]
MHAARQQRDVLLHPGEYFVGDADCRVSTLLGSCVSITLWHPERLIGAMSHFLLSTRSVPKVSELDGRYGDEAILLMLKGLVRHGVDPRECVAKLFGGGNMFPDRKPAHAQLIGLRNGEAARCLLQGLEIPLVAESLFGVGHRQIIFDIATGRVWSRQHALPTAPT